MRTVKLEKQALLTKIKANRDNHRKIFEEALEGYKKVVTQTLERALEATKAGKRPNLYFNLEKPEDQTRLYDRVIAMLEMSMDNVVELTEQEFAQYVQDDWSWKQNFLTKMSAYSSTAAVEATKYGNEEEVA